ncbi:MAG: hypothetical protein K2F87_06085 [Muribaculaceae bacterium]|nr:hypothetical protein [Muribaculaceae bacterium]
MKFCRRHIAPLCAAILMAAGYALQSCRGKGEEAPAEPEIIVQVGDTALTMTDVLRRIPQGLAAADSTALFNSVVESWLERILLDELARDNIDDMDHIERMVEEYRRKLIVASYRRTLRASHRWKVPEDSVRRYYEAHQEELTLERPVVKGLYVKLPADASRRADIRLWMIPATPDAIDNLEKYGLRDAIEYSFFEDSWTDWNLIARQIPYRFEDADQFVRNKQNFETTYGGMTYLLHISGYKPGGETMPYEVAAPLIAERLEGVAGERYERELIRNLYVQARKDGRLRDYRSHLYPGAQVDPTKATDNKKKIN